MIKNLLIRTIPVATILVGSPLFLSLESTAQIKSAKASLAPAAADSAAKPLFTAFVSGTGELFVNDVRITNGASVVSGSVVAAGPDADATIDLGQLGRILIRPNTAVKVSFSGKACEIEMQRCGSLTEILPDGVSTEVKLALPKLAEVSSARGQVQVSDGPDQKGRVGKQVVKEGKRKKIYGASSLSANGESTFTVNCCQCCMVDHYHQ